MCVCGGATDSLAVLTPSPLTFLHWEALCSIERFAACLAESWAIIRGGRDGDGMECRGGLSDANTQVLSRCL